MGVEIDEVALNLRVSRWLIQLLLYSVYIQYPRNQKSKCRLVGFFILFLFIFLVLFCLKPVMSFWFITDTVAKIVHQNIQKSRIRSPSPSSMVPSSPHKTRVSTSQRDLVFTNTTTEPWNTHSKLSPHPHQSDPHLPLTRSINHTTNNNPSSNVPNKRNPSRLLTFPALQVYIISNPLNHKKPQLHTSPIK